MADIRVIILESKVPPSALIPAPTPAPPVALPAFIFTYERREVFPKLFIYHGVKMEFQPWYFQARTKFQVDYTHLSERDRFFYIHSKLKNKVFGQVQSWVKIMTERETFSVQRLFDQLILAYNNLQSMEIAAKELNKIKQGNKQPFFTFIWGFGKKMLETGGMDFSDQITKKFLNNALNNEMHKAFIGFFIPATYIAYYTILRGINN